jgi:hypothetical protein
VVIQLATEPSMGFVGLLVGRDGRVSTSKTMAALWTVTLVFALLYLSFNLVDADAADDVLAVDPLYLLLLGGPFATWVLAKGVVQSKVAAGRVQKVTAAEPPPLRDIVSDDNGELSLTDVQYASFSPVALCFFYFSFLASPQAAVQLPQLPEALVLVTSGSALAYLGQKSLMANGPHHLRRGPTARAQCPR